MQLLSLFFGDAVGIWGAEYPGGLMKAGNGMGSPKKYPSSSSSDEEDEEVNDGYVNLIGSLSSVLRGILKVTRGLLRL